MQLFWGVNIPLICNYSSSLEWKKNFIWQIIFLFIFIHVKTLICLSNLIYLKCRSRLKLNVIGLDRFVLKIHCVHVNLNKTSIQVYLQKVTDDCRILNLIKTDIISLKKSNPINAERFFSRKWVDLSTPMQSYQKNINK